MGAFLQPYCRLAMTAAFCHEFYKASKKFRQISEMFFILCLTSNFFLLLIKWQPNLPVMHTESSHVPQSSFLHFYPGLMALGAVIAMPSEK